MRIPRLRLTSRGRLAPAGAMGLSVLLGYGMVFGPHPPTRHGRLPTGHFVAYRGRHRPGDIIGPNAKVVTIDRRGDPLSVVSTDGKPPVVWAFELADPSDLTPIGGRHVHRFGLDPWLRPACPSPLCPGDRPGATIPSPPPPLAIDICPALSAADLASVIGHGPISAHAPSPGVCVWDNGRAGVEIEVGRAEWWRYLTGLTGLYKPAVTEDELVDGRAGLHIAVRRGPITVVLLTYVDESVDPWARVAWEVATWVAAH